MSDIQQIELTKEQAEQSVKLMERLDRLNKNRDFKAIIEDELFDSYSKSLVLLLSDPSMQEDVVQKDLILDMQMIGRFRQFLSGVFQKGRLAEKTLEDATRQLEELRAEGADE
ncbi:coil containing protein [Vibrio phage 1.152.O._10N.222.46.E1]|uniref:Coil containing protein n=5 Tax=Nahantvirus 49C7 TaxID=2846601 RepID=A0A2I7RBC6_9CAUD|nr:coil containing protein [Vibrio phage 1.026.O._10N.222.49.C7]AUR82501.1 coil containing protein [Vibrio phage 1.025.O._10N.222.46.B6]AUR90751.1 coil containing protein [Vibrio phage 1.150.O._10N.222.46.A6]AUR90924.1 coil containing protein [Vibrio phage 1.152.O._10N.222.46.E1]AUS02392.1 coil containing protein [Vibrio phage 2.130.O._10N.222.46.C2]AUR82609.1 coil containing protein [Vibrio phage 1.026.O._10N.222.49.C7]